MWCYSWQNKHVASGVSEGPGGRLEGPGGARVAARSIPGMVGVAWDAPSVAVKSPPDTPKNKGLFSMSGKYIKFCKGAFVGN